MVKTNTITTTYEGYSVKVILYLVFNLLSDIAFFKLINVLHSYFKSFVFLKFKQVWSSIELASIFCESPLLIGPKG